MNDQTSVELNEIARSLRLYRYQNELESAKNTPEQTILLTQMISHLNNKKVVPNKTKLLNVFAEMDKNIFHTTWAKLPIFHKLVKVKEYVQKNNLDPDIELQLVTAIENGKLKKQGEVDYNTELCEIVDIPLLKKS